LLIKKLIPLYIGAIIGPIGGNGVVTLLPVLAQAWGIEFAAASLSITLYMIPFIVFQIFSGSIAQIFDVRKTLLLGFVIYTIGGFLTGISDSFFTFILCRILQGTGSAFLNPIIMAMIGEMVPARHIGKAMGALGFAYTAGMTLGPLISGVIEVHYGWPYFFFFLSAASAMTTVLFLLWCKDMGGGAVARQSIRDIFPLIGRAIDQPGLLHLSFAAFALFMAYIGILTFTADYMKTTFRMPSDEVGFLISLTGFSGIVASPFAGVMGDRFGRRKVLMGGMAVVFLAILLMAAMDFDYLSYALLFLLLGAGSATAWTSLNTIVILSAPALRNPVTSIYNVIKFTGYAFSPVILSVFYNSGHLRTVQYACGVAVIISAILVVRAKMAGSHD